MRPCSEFEVRLRRKRVLTHSYDFNFRFGKLKRIGGQCVEKATPHRGLSRDQTPTECVAVFDR